MLKFDFYPTLLDSENVSIVCLKPEKIGSFSLAETLVWGMILLIKDYNSDLPIESSSWLLIS